ncbi:filamentous hemagglutinin N-terminal domain-containing protein [Caballeronia novacaledonica]|uniref:Filamentous hemagglutinin N-terminal domain-containing protein n=1 Tax=Caballeronia novacaledonica TaxID=1544861 RepID=A0ACB5QSN5_9BURK|nr:filamentous hemagglutinin N-terminal domain-containing protein [Caballeronia novacaledonica]
MIKALRASTASPALRFCSATLLSAAFAYTHAEPTGARVVGGSGSVTSAGPNTTIQQNSGRLAIDWNSFSTRPGESVTFNQPGANAIALNRVVGPRPSALFGKLDANGQVFIVNPNGVIFGPGAQVNVGGLLASSLDLSTNDFMSGHYTFAGGERHHHHRGGGAVVNLGTIESAPGGYVALIGTRAINAGTIDSPGGFAALAAGERIAVTLGDHSMIGLSVERGALNALAANHGLIQADGGQAWLAASAEDALFNNVVNNTGIIRARSAVNQNGVIRLVADTGVVQVGGTLDASAPNGGNGGIIETAGTQVRVAPDTQVTTAAASGQTGTWRIASDFAALVGADDDIGRRFGTIQSATLSRVLESTNVSISAASPPGFAPFGFVLIDGPVAWRGANMLSLAAQSGIRLDASISAPRGTLSMTTAGTATQRAPIEAANVALQGGAGVYQLTNAGNRIGTFAANAGSIALADSAPLTIGNVAGLTGVSASGAVTLTAPSLTLAAPVASRASGTAITLAAATFVNRAGAQALATPNGRWLVYSDAPDSDAFGGLQSANLALWGDAYTGGADARAASASGNRFAFNALQQVTLTAINLDVPFDTPRTLGPNDVTIALRYNGANYGGAFADSPAIHEPFVFTVTSTGAAPGATIGTYAITITATGGPTGYKITTQGGTLRIAGAPSQPVTPPSPPVQPVTPETPGTVVTTAATVPGILDSVRTDAANPAPLYNATPGLQPESAPLVQQRTDSTSDGSRLPDDAWPGHVCRM